MPILLQDLGRNVVGGATNSFLDFALMLYPGRQSKVADFGVHVVIDQDIAQLEIAVDNRMRMNVDEGFHNLLRIYSGFVLGHSLSPLH